MYGHMGCPVLEARKQTGMIYDNDQSASRWRKRDAHGNCSFTWAVLLVVGSGGDDTDDPEKV